MELFAGIAVVLESIKAIPDLCVTRGGRGDRKTLKERDDLIKVKNVKWGAVPFVLIPGDPIDVSVFVYFALCNNYCVKELKFRHV